MIVQVQIRFRCRTGADTEVQRCRDTEAQWCKYGGTAQVQICRYGGARCWVLLSSAGV